MNFSSAMVFAGVASAPRAWNPPRDMETPPDPPPETSIEALLAQARGGDERALEALFRRARPRLCALARTRIGRSGRGLVAPSDLAQEAALRAARGFSTFNGTSAAAWFAWLKTIVERLDEQLRRDAKRKKRDIPAVVTADEDGEAMDVPALEKSPSQAAALEEEWRHVYACIYKLPERQRDAIVLFHLKELSASEIAQRLGTTMTAVSGLLQRGLRALQMGIAEGAEASLDPEDTVTAALREYVLRRDAGDRLDLDAFAQAHPACAEELRAMLRWAARIEALRPASDERQRDE
jgi:RNA polymerase sigma-70 factor, ECF subfamily